MTGDEMRAVLTAACDVRWPGAVSNANTVDALLPVVRKIAADALRAEADELREVALLAKEGQQWNPHRVWTWLSDRADALDPS